MNIHDALAVMRAGRIVRRESWPADELHLFLTVIGQGNERLRYCHALLDPKVEPAPAEMYPEDVEADDWEECRYRCQGCDPQRNAATGPLILPIKPSVRD